jgi:iron complex transport system substrate-binding protein
MTGVKRLIAVLGLFALGVVLSLVLQHWTAPPPDDGGDGGIPQRVIVASPGLVECVFAIGAGDRVVGVSQFACHPPEATRKPSIGGAFNPSFDRILELQPDLVIVQSKAEKLADFCRQHDIRIVHLDLETIDDILAAIRSLGQLLGCSDGAAAAAAGLRRDLDALARRVAGRPRPRVFLCMGHTPGSLRSLGSAGGGTFLTELVTLAGGDSVLADVTVPYPTVSKEDLVARAPEVIIELRPASREGESLPGDARSRLVADWQLLPTLPAVRNGRIHILTEPYLLIPGPRAVLTVRRLAEAIHPDVEARHAR